MEALEAAEVEFAVCGGLAVAIHAQPRKTDPDSEDLLSIDLLVVTAELEPVRADRVRVGWEDGELPVVSREGLVRMKRLRASGQDLDDIQALENEADGEA